MRKLIRRFLCWAYPELRILCDKNYDFSKLLPPKNMVNRQKHIVLYAPYFVSESEIGDYTYVAKNSHISKATIGKFCSIGPNLICGWGIHPTNGISTAPMFYSTMKQNEMTFSEVDKTDERKPISIGNDVFIGANVTILDGVTIGDGAVIGAGAVVSKDIPPYAIAVGCPIKVIRYRFEEGQIEALKRIEWWNFPEEKLKNVEKYFFDVKAFLDLERSQE